MTLNIKTVPQSSEWCATTNAANKELIELGLVQEVQPSPEIRAQELAAIRAGKSKEDFNIGCVAFLQAVVALLKDKAKALADVYPGDAKQNYSPRLRFKGMSGSCTVEVELYDRSYLRVVIGNYGTKTIYKSKVGIAILAGEKTLVERTAKEVGQRVENELQNQEWRAATDRNNARRDELFQGSKAMFETVGISYSYQVNLSNEMLHSDKVHFSGNLEQ